MPDEMTDGFTPEELEAINAPGEAEGEGEPAGNPEPEPERDTRFRQVEEDSKEAKARARYAEEEARQTRLQLLQIMSNQQQQHRQTQPEVDPDAKEFVTRIDPALRQWVQPLIERLNYLEQKTGAIEVETVGNKAFKYVEQNVPDLSEISGDLMAYIDSRPDKELILADPNRVIDCAEIVRVKRASGKPAVAEQVRREARNRGRSEGPSIVSRSDNRDWGKASEAELAAEMKRQGFF